MGALSRLSLSPGQGGAARVQPGREFWRRALLAAALGWAGGGSPCGAAELAYSTRANTMAWFESARFGVFIHWDARSNWTRSDGRYNVDIRPETKRAQEEAVWGDVLDGEGKPTGRKRWQEWNPTQLAADAWRMLPAAVIPTGPDVPLPAKASASSENQYKRPSGKTAGNPAAGVTEAQRGAPWSASEPWSEAGADPSPWLQLDLGQARAVGGLYVREHHSRVRRFVIEHRAGAKDEWKPILTGRRLNHLSYRLARPESMRFVRIRFPRTEGGAPQVSRFAVYPPR